MQTYAMLLQNRVIGILTDQESEPWWPPDPEGVPVLAVPCGEEVALGMRYDPETGTFSEPAPEPIPPDPAPEPTQLDNIEQTQLTMMEAMADQYEESQERELTNMDVLATMYEEILSIKGEA